MDKKEQKTNPAIPKKDADGSSIKEDDKQNLATNSGDSEEKRAVKNNWKTHMYRVGSHFYESEEAPSDVENIRKNIEPWLTAVFQSEHLSLLLGSGFTIGLANTIGSSPKGMAAPKFDGECAANIEKAAIEIAKSSDRGYPNFEDYIRIANELLRGLEVLADARAKELKTQIKNKLLVFLESILDAERSLNTGFCKGDEISDIAHNQLVSFLLSFASRTASRERLNIFTTNYDRLIEYGCDLAGIRIIDRFVGVLQPVFRASRINIDLHYNPPGIRGEPRYLEGVIRLFKLHGSIDWRFNDKKTYRCGIPFGASMDHPEVPSDPIESFMIYPNSAKDVETCQYPYAELFRDFAASICRPNSSLVVYGYGFGDDHVNRVIKDMLTIPSTHLVIISFDNPGRRIEDFCNKIGHNAQISLLIGSHFGSFENLVDNYLPKPAIDLISFKRTALLRNREPSSGGIPTNDESKSKDLGGM